jgi:hypothetical protein
MLTLLSACGGNTAQSPVAPTVSTSAVTVTSALQAGPTVQLTAMARLSDGGSRDVTALALWECSTPSLAAVSNAGLLTITAPGGVNVRATYQSVVGTLQLLATGPSAPTTFEISGEVTEIAPASRILSGVRLEITEGPDSGTTVTSDASGLFRFATATPGVIGLEATKDGYLVWSVSQLTVNKDYRQMEVVLYPVPPEDQSGATPTTRCKDGTWSWAKTRADACPASGGIAYAVCPGLLCE